jgi:hypothetical protein
MGVVRATRPDDPLLVRVWVAHGSGIVLTADETFGDQFGIEPHTLVGRGVASLGTDLEALDRFVADATSRPAEEVGELVCRTQLLHR